MKNYDNILFNITNKCNLRCWHCYNNSSFEQNFIDQEITKKICYRILEFSPKVVSISGGEPLLTGDTVLNVAKIFKQANIKTVLITNGTMINEKNIDRIMQHFDLIQMSVDIYDNEEYSALCKGNKFYGKMLKSTIETLKKYKVPTIFSHVPNKFNYKISSYFDFFYYPELQSFVTQYAIDVGRASLNNDYNLSEEEKQIYIEELTTIAKEFKIPVKMYLPNQDYDHKNLVVTPQGKAYTNSFYGEMVCDLLNPS